MIWILYVEETEMILIDTSIWIEFFKGNPETADINEFIDNNDICTNSIILAELRPIILSKRQYALDDLLLCLPTIPVHIVWDNLIQMQCVNIKNGINKVGIPDLMIVQNAIQNNVIIWTLDKHFFLMNKLIPFKLYGVDV